jgi:acetyltransferase-like isoleucine patch superfamily enzyme
MTRYPRLKQFLARIGLLPAASFVRHFFTPFNLAKFYSAFLYYFYNYWLSRFPWHGFRVTYLRRVLGFEIGPMTFIHMGCLFYGKIKIGRNSVIGRECHLLGDITIGNNVSITAQTYIFSATHFKDSPDFSAHSVPVVIEDYVWTGARAMILPGVRIGKGAILGAASVATKNIPEFSVAVGSPARSVSQRSRDLTYELNYFPYFE